MKLIGGGGSCPGVKAIQDGKWFGTIIAFPYDEGVIGGKIAIEAARGAKVSKGTSAALSSHRSPLLTKSNLNGFKCEWQG
jgi:ABC-type sugar transport system substrate-binding protein